MVKQLVPQLSVQPEAGQLPQTPPGGQSVARLASTQQSFTQVPPIGQTEVSWHACVLQAAVVETQVSFAQTVLSAQSVFRAQPGWQRGWAGSSLQLAPRGQSVFEAQPARQLFEPSGLASQIWPLEQSESALQSVSKKHALARHR